MLMEEKAVIVNECDFAVRSGCSILKYHFLNIQMG
jgi:hypothetical protein